MFLQHFLVYTLIAVTWAQRHEIIAGKSYYFSVRETNGQEAFLDCDNMNASLADREDPALRDYLQQERETEYWTMSKEVREWCAFVGSDESALTFGTKECSEDMPYICVQQEGERGKPQLEKFTKIGSTYYYISEQNTTWFDAYTDCFYANASLVEWKREDISNEFEISWLMEPSSSYWTSRKSFTDPEKSFQMCASAKAKSKTAEFTHCTELHRYICSVNGAARRLAAVWLLTLSLVYFLMNIFI